MAIYETLSAQTRTIRSNSRSSRIGAFRVRPIRSMFKMRTAPDRSEAVAAEAFRASVRRARLRPVCSAITKIKSLVSKLFRCINPAQKESMNSAGDTIATYCMQTGSQYYTMARFAMHAQCVPVCGNLFHHAVEMLLKGGLARKRPLSDLKDNMGHNLKVLWREFKLEFPDRNSSTARQDNFKSQQIRGHPLPGPDQGAFHGRERGLVRSGRDDDDVWRTSEGLPPHQFEF